MKVKIIRSRIDFRCWRRFKLIKRIGESENYCNTIIGYKKRQSSITHLTLHFPFLFLIKFTRKFTTYQEEIFELKMQKDKLEEEAQGLQKVLYQLIADEHQKEVDEDFLKAHPPYIIHPKCTDIPCKILRPGRVLTEEDFKKIEIK